MLGFARGQARSLAPGQPLARFDHRQLLAARGQLALHLAQVRLGRLRLAFERAAFLDLAAQGGGARLHLRQHRIEQCAQIDHIAYRSGPQQRQQRGAARQPLERAGQPRQRGLPRRHPRTQARPLGGDAARAGLLGGDGGLRFLNARGHGSGFACGLLGLGSDGAGIGLQPLGPFPGDAPPSAWAARRSAPA
ncbi:hypothetical protein ACFSTD_19060 [Novosphingobium colocasiae]